MENERKEGMEVDLLPEEPLSAERTFSPDGEEDSRGSEDPYSEEPVPEAEGEAQSDGEDPLGEYRRRAREDLDALRRLRPEYGEAESLAELPLAVPFALFRGMGYSVEEALAFAESGAARLGGKSHQRPVATHRRGATETGMTHREMAECRELFGDGLSDGEIRALYLRVTR